MWWRRFDFHSQCISWLMANIQPCQPITWLTSIHSANKQGNKRNVRKLLKVDCMVYEHVTDLDTDRPLIIYEEWVDMAQSSWSRLCLYFFVWEYTVLGIWHLQPSRHQLHPHSCSNKLFSLPTSGSFHQADRTHMGRLGQLTESHGMWTAYYDVDCSAPKQQRHSHLNDMMWRDIERAQNTAVKKPVNVMCEDSKRTNGSTLLAWVKGKSITRNVTERDK